MRIRPDLLLSALLIAACERETADVAGDWVLTFPSLFVPSNGFQCRSLSGTLLEIEQDGDKVVAPYSQGLLVCASSPVDSIPVVFAQGRIRGTIGGDYLDVSFEGTVGRFSGRVHDGTASGEINYTEPTYGVTVTGSWTAVRRTPAGSLNVAFSSSSSSGSPLPPILFVLDGDTALQAPANGSIPLPRLTAGRHLLRVYTGGSRSCGVGGGPSGSFGGTNPNEQLIDIVESDPLRSITYEIGCS
jgi:hypothetical protein